MAGICVTSIRKSGAGCDHRIVTVDLDGESIELHTGEGELDSMAWGDEEKRQFLLLSAKRARVLGLALDDAVGRVFIGEEATNVKQYGILTKDVTKTNIGASYVNVPPGANGERTLVEFTGCTQFRLTVHAVLAQTGPYQMRIVRDSDDAVLYESASINAAAGEREFDTGIQELPAAATGLIYVRFQARSVTAADDPVFRRCILMVR
jgi:hypothetical protein